MLGIPVLGTIELEKPPWPPGGIRALMTRAACCA
jgi:hypothetical protein